MSYNNLLMLVINKIFVFLLKPFGQSTNAGSNFNISTITEKREKMTFSNIKLLNLN